MASRRPVAPGPPERSRRPRLDAERQRLADPAWKQWGPYLSERAWGTVREDYSAGGDAWESFPHDDARFRTYRWSEDGIGGLSDDGQRLCFGLALWNGADPFLKERLFGVTNEQGNHGEDVKEYYYYLDSTPTHSWMQFLYRYPQRAFPYDDLVAVNRRRSRLQPEYELIDTGIFDDDRYFDVLIEYAKAGPTDILIRVSATNRGPDPAELHLLPHLWFRNTWDWHRHALRQSRPELIAGDAGAGWVTIAARHPELGRYALAAQGEPTLLFTRNESNLELLYGVPNRAPYTKDGIDAAVVRGLEGRLDPELVGTKAAAHYRRALAPGETWQLRLRLSDAVGPVDPFAGYDRALTQRQREADRFYAGLHSPQLDAEERAIQRQALAGILWSKQYYHYPVRQWLEGDGDPAPPASRLQGRNRLWPHLVGEDIIAMPDTWEYPWFAAWDLAFHCGPLAMVDPAFAKQQLELLGRERYQHPNGQYPAYEWDFGDVNPPVQAWAAYRLFAWERATTGVADHAFLARMYHSLVPWYVWWLNRKDVYGNDLFSGGFLGMDNIGVFDRSHPPSGASSIVQCDGTAWMGTFSLWMLAIVMELAKEDPLYRGVAIRFAERFLRIAAALNSTAGGGFGLWDDQDQFYYDVLKVDDADPVRLRVRSVVGLIPLLATVSLPRGTVLGVPELARWLRDLATTSPELLRLIETWQDHQVHDRTLISLCAGDRLRAVLRRMLDENEFLSPYGIRALSRAHKDHPFVLEGHGAPVRVDYEPAESATPMFGGNSNWRGPIWFPVNFLLIQALRNYGAYYGDALRVECPTGSGVMMTLTEVADEISRRLVRIFKRDPETGDRPVFGGARRFQDDPRWRDDLLFYEYFNGDDGAGLGASHQTGWTALVAVLMQSPLSRDRGFAG